MKLRVSHGPHLFARETTQTLMLDVIIALMPTTLAGIYIFGTRAVLVIAISVISSVLFELIWQKLMKKRVTITDLSAVVTGLLLGLNLPCNVPLWMPVIGSAVAILLVKQLFGGIGHNFMNPALFARAVLLASWPLHMTTYNLPQRLFLGSETALSGVDTVASATPLLSIGKLTNTDLLIGNIPGSIGEVCKVAIIIGFIYLMLTKTITWHVPVTFIGTVIIMSYLIGVDGIRAVLTGGVLFGAVFMATDYVTNPMYRLGQCIFGVMCGIIVVVIRKYGGYPEGVTYAILFMNCVSPLIDRYSKKKIYGEVKKSV